MSVWDGYYSRIASQGANPRERSLGNSQRMIRSKIRSSPSYHRVVIDNADKQVAIINSDNLNEKTIIALPGEKFDCGADVEWMGYHWLISEVDANDEAYCKGIMLQCNYELRWIDERDRQIHKQWCVVGDGTKYLTGETMSSYNLNGMVLGDTRIGMIIARNKYTGYFSRSDRFIIDDKYSKHTLAYRLTKPFKVGGVYNGKGAMSFVLVEVNTEEDDNLDLQIANYYKYFPRETYPDPVDPGTTETEIGRVNWL